MCIDTVSLPNVSRYGDISIYRCISNLYRCMSLFLYLVVLQKAVKVLRKGLKAIATKLQCEQLMVDHVTSLCIVTA